MDSGWALVGTILSPRTYKVPPFSDNDVPNQLLPIPPHFNISEARELHSTRTNHDVCLGSEVQDVALREIHTATHDEDNSPHYVDHVDLGTHEPQWRDASNHLTLPPMVLRM